jgi:tetratricopeptide (TPR) repeat protein
VNRPGQSETYDQTSDERGQAMERDRAADVDGSWLRDRPERFKGRDAAKKGDWDSAVAYYREAVAADPKAIEARVGLERAMREAAMAHITRAKKLEADEQWQGAAQEYRLAVRVRAVKRDGS